ncbi:MAG: DegT/DnrJ/EryC1/StrS family aminotransferase [Candidatus Cyclobacteriaceae bacterium M2_1C_046]
MGGKEQSYIKEAFDTNWISPLGPNVNNFEEDLESYNKVKHAAALSSGTSAIHLSLIIQGIDPGDEVICQSFTFSASANPIKYQGATPVFIDSETATWNMSPGFLKEAVDDLISKTGKKPKAIIPVHLYGMPAKINEIMAIANEYEIPVIEDAAEALGSTYKDRKCGSFGKYGIYSFNGNKIITTSGGGALVSEDESIINKARFLATQARDQAPHYQHSKVGYNYRLSNVLAGIGRGQMQVLDERVRQRRANFAKYKKYFEGINKKGFDIEFQPEQEGSYSNRWLTCILVDPTKNNGLTREDIRFALEEENIESRPLWKPMHLQPVFKDAPFYGDGISERLFEIGLCLPSGSNLTEEEFERIFDVLDKIFTNR